MDLLKHAQMVEAKPFPPPMISTVGASFSAYQGSLLDDPSNYGSIVEALQYLTLTRLDIAFVVNKVF